MYSTETLIITNYISTRITLPYSLTNEHDVRLLVANAYPDVSSTVKLHAGRVPQSRDPAQVCGPREAAAARNANLLQRRLAAAV